MLNGNPIEYLIKHSLGVGAGDSVALIHDHTYSEIVQHISSYCQSNGIPLTNVFSDSGIDEPIEDNVKSIFLDDHHKVIILALSKNIWHTPERKQAKYDRGKRLANVLHPGKPCSSYMADIWEMAIIGNELDTLLNKSKSITVTSAAGTDLTAQIGIVFCETGNYRTSGTGGDFPPGEVGFGPIEYSVNGRIVFDYKVQHVGSVKDNHHIIKIERDYVEEISGTQEFSNLLDSHKVFKYISEISIGINPIWSDVDDPKSIVEEKNLGTIHFGFGGNLSYGNRIGPHFDAVILNPTIYLDNVLVMKNGSLSITL